MLKNTCFLVAILLTAACSGASTPATPPGPPNPNVAVCGNNTQETGEVCDGNTVLGTCNANCSVFTPIQSNCGNGTQETGEVCDGNTVLGTCSGDCKTFIPNPGVPAPVCGDGNLNPGEACDDSNTVAGDGCSATCQLETAVCGDGNLNPGETCDDRNTVAGDGCSATCQTEAAVCGNGRLEAGEGCDDNNTTNGDGCSSACTVEQVAGNTPNPLMNFFVTSVGNGANGGNFGGLTGADARCQQFAAAVGMGGKTWHAYLSTWDAQPANRVHARDRIGTGPWYNYAGTQVAANVTALHAAGIITANMLTENGQVVPNDEHDILTGSQADGTSFDSHPGNPGTFGPTCTNWTSSADTAYGYVGHATWSNEGRPADDWTSAHEVQCDPASLDAAEGNARIYCFAIN